MPGEFAIDLGVRIVVRLDGFDPSMAAQIARGLELHRFRPWNAAEERRQAWLVSIRRATSLDLAEFTPWHRLGRRARLLDPVRATYADRGGRLLIVDLQAMDKCRVQLVVEPGFEEDVFRIVAFSLFEALVVRAGGAIVHANALQNSRTGSVMLICGGSGSGKSNLSLAMLLSGSHALLSEDRVPLDGEGNVYAFPRVMHLFDYNLREFAELRAHVGRPSPFRSLAGQALHRAGGSLPEPLRGLAERKAKGMTHRSVPFGMLGLPMDAKAPVDTLLVLDRTSSAEPSLTQAEGCMAATSAAVFAVHEWVAESGDHPWRGGVAAAAASTTWEIVRAGLSDCRASFRVEVPKDGMTRRTANRLVEMLRDAA